MGTQCRMRTAVWSLGLLVALTSGGAARAQEMEEEGDTKEGQTLAPSFTCGRYTTRTVLIGSSTVSNVASAKGTRRCAILYKLTDCNEMKLTCTKFYVDNRDPYKCRRGDVFNVRSTGGKPMKFCKLCWKLITAAPNSALRISVIQALLRMSY